MVWYGMIPEIISNAEIVFEGTNKLGTTKSIVKVCFTYNLQPPQPPQPPQQQQQQQPNNIYRHLFIVYHPLKEMVRLPQHSMGKACQCPEVPTPNMLLDYPLEGQPSLHLLLPSSTYSHKRFGMS
jgi:hypothetical protein